MSGLTRTIVLSDGGLSSLLACVAARELALTTVPAPTDSEPLPKPVVVSATLPLGSARARAEAIARQCEALDLEMMNFPVDISPGSSAHTHSLTHTLDLVRAGYAAVTRESSHILWPVHFRHEREIDLEAVSDAVDRALLIGRVLTIDNAGSPVRIDVPYADLTDRQMADLVLDMDAPANLCWWWHAQLADPAIAGSRDEFLKEHQRWTTALSAVGWQAPP